MESKEELQSLERTNEIVEEFSHKSSKLAQLKLRSYSLNSLSELKVRDLTEDSLEHYKLVSIDVLTNVIVTKVVYIQKIKNTSYSYSFPSTEGTANEFSNTFNRVVIKEVPDYTYQFYTVDDSPYAAFRLKDYQKTWYLFDECSTA